MNAPVICHMITDWRDHPTGRSNQQTDIIETPVLDSAFKLQPRRALHSAPNPEHLSVELGASSCLGSLEELYAMPDAKFFVDGLLKEKSISAMFGVKKSGKSYAAIDLLCSIASGQDFMGRPVKQGKVVYIGLEGQESNKDRIGAWETRKGIVPPENIRLYKNSRFHILDKSHLEKLILDVESFGEEGDGTPVKLILFDTYSRIVPGEDKNSSVTASAVIDAFEEIVERTSAAVQFIAHQAKGSNSPSISGSGDLENALDTSIQIKKKDSTSYRSQLKLIDQRQGDDQFEVVFRLNRVHYKLGLNKEPIESEDPNDKWAFVAELETGGFTDSNISLENVSPLAAKQPSESGASTTAGRPKSGKQENADRLLDIIREKIQDTNEYEIIADGTHDMEGDRQCLDAAKKQLKAELEEKPENSDKKPDTINRQVSRAYEKLEESGRLSIEKDKIWINLPYSKPVDEIPF